ncbi:MAG: aminotransferase [Micrococcales bacterium]|nr:MAG: aminotransferase [Micrococcales bacterium]PIE27826.1 MAG: aminotransferase [Micrococcales bacterium]
MVDVRVSSQAKQRVAHVLDSGRLATGPVVAELEAAFAAASGTQHCVAVANGTLALQAAISALDIGPGDEVITTPFTFIATVNAVLAQGATVRYADIAPDFTIDPQRVREVITDRTKALLPVHLFGLPANMPQLHAIAAEHGLGVIEDAAQAHGAAVTGSGSGTGTVGGLGDIGCFSLYATKNLSAGEGGLLTTDDDQLADRLRTIRNQGMRARYDYAGWGSNYRMSDLHAAVVVDQVPLLEDINIRRRRNAQRLLDGLADVAGLRPPIVPAGFEHVWHQFTVLLDDPSARAAFIASLTAAGIGSDVFYPQAMSQVAHLSNHPRVAPDPVPRAEDYARRVVSLPVGHHLDIDQIDRVIDAVKGALDG